MPETDNNTCRKCGGAIKMMARKYTGICSEGCEKKEKHNHGR